MECNQSQSKIKIRPLLPSLKAKFEAYRWIYNNVLLTLSFLQFSHNPLKSSVLLFRSNLKQQLQAVFTIRSASSSPVLRLPGTNSFTGANCRLTLFLFLVLLPSVHPSIHFPYLLIQLCWSLSQLSGGERRGTHWTGCQPIAGLAPLHYI